MVDPNGENINFLTTVVDLSKGNTYHVVFVDVFAIISVAFRKV